MIIQLVSDLHLEKQNKQNINGLDYITPSGEILILNGDISSLYLLPMLLSFFNSIKNHFKHIIYVPGNNEFYTQKDLKPLPFITLYKRLEILRNEIHNLIILDNSYIIINDTIFCGSVLWSYVHYNLPNFVKIHDFTTKEYNYRNLISKRFIKRVIQLSNDTHKELVMITHYPPSKRCLTEDKKRFYYNRLYYNNLDYLFDNKILWLFGHTHENKDIKIGNTRILSNQRGKKSYKEYQRNFTLKI
jgi:predicted phosphodiesterase